MSDEVERTIALRLREAIAQAGGIRAVARLSAVPERTITRYLSGDSSPPAATLGRIAATLGISLDWLVGHDMPASVGAPAPSNLSSERLQANPDTIYIPLMSAVAMAGNGWNNHEVEVIEKLPFSRELLRRLGVQREFAHFIQHTGDSMYPTLQDGGVSLVDTSRSRARDGKIFALMIGDDLVIKRLQVTPRGLTLISDNGDRYPPVELSGDELEQVKIMGQVFWSGGVV